MKHFTDVYPGKPISARDYNRLLDTVQDLNLQVEAPLELVNGNLRLANQGFNAMILDSDFGDCAGQPYAWAAVQPDGIGGWVIVDGLGSGTTEVNPAYEKNGNCVSIGTVVWMEPGANGEYIFEMCCLGGGGSAGSGGNNGGGNLPKFTTTTACIPFLDCNANCEYLTVTYPSELVSIGTSPIPCANGVPIIPPTSGTACNLTGPICLSWSQPSQEGPDCPPCDNPAPPLYTINEEFAGVFAQFSGESVYTPTDTIGQSCIYSRQFNTVSDQSSDLTISFGAVTLTFQIGDYYVQYQADLEEWDCSGSNTLEYVGGNDPDEEDFPDEITVYPSYVNPGCNGMTTLTNNGQYYYGVATIGNESVQFYLYGGSVESLVLVAGGTQYPLGTNNCNNLTWFIPSLGGCDNLTFVVTNGSCVSGSSSGSGPSGGSPSGSVSGSSSGPTNPCNLPNKLCGVFSSPPIEGGSQYCAFCPNDLTGSPYAWVITFPQMPPVFCCPLMRMMNCRISLSR